MVIYIQDFLERRHVAARQAPARLVAVAGGLTQAAPFTRTRDRLMCVPALVGHEAVAAGAPGTLPDLMTLYAEASLI